MSLAVAARSSSQSLAHGTRHLVRIEAPLGVEAHVGRGLESRDESSLAVAGMGVVMGLVGALVAARSIEALLFGVAPFDPPTFIAIPFLLIVVALLASYLPARRAARIDPVRCLRSE